MDDKNFIERLTAGLYRVTDRMEDEEPLKWRLRSSALEFSELLLQDRKHVSFREEEDRATATTSLLKGIIRMLELAASFSFVSRVNFEVLLREYESLENKLFGKETVLLHAETEVKNESEELSLRKKKITDFLNTNPNSSISSLVHFFDSSVGEKTLQRDLNDLVVHGVVKATGERRWRTYSLSDIENHQ